MFGVIDGEKTLGRCLKTLLQMLSLNLWFLLYCLPVATIGAATAALYQVTIAMAEKRSKDPGQEFREAFRENFRSVTPVWLVLLLFLLTLGMDTYLNWLGLLGEQRTVWYVVLAVAVAMVFAYGDWVYALSARFVNGRRNTMKNAAMFLARFLPVSLLLAAGSVLLSLYLFSQPYFWPAAFWLGFSFPAWVKGKFFAEVFAPYVRQERDGEEKSAGLTETEECRRTLEDMERLGI